MKFSKIFSLMCLLICQTNITVERQSSGSSAPHKLDDIEMLPACALPITRKDEAATKIAYIQPKTNNINTNVLLPEKIDLKASLEKEKRKKDLDDSINNEIIVLTTITADIKKNYSKLSSQINKFINYIRTLGKKIINITRINDLNFFLTTMKKFEKIIPEIAKCNNSLKLNCENFEKQILTHLTIMHVTKNKLIPTINFQSQINSITKLIKECEEIKDNFSKEIKLLIDENEFCEKNSLILESIYNGILTEIEQSIPMELVKIEQEQITYFCNHCPFNEKDRSKVIEHVLTTHLPAGFTSEEVGELILDDQITRIVF